MNLFQLRKSVEAKTGKPLPASKVATDLKVSKQRYGNYEQGKQVPDIFLAQKMADYFRQWLPDLTLDKMAAIVQETVNQQGEQ
jgi:DNA-binding XRE family transcriptional regulator